MTPSKSLDRALIGMELIQEILETTFFTCAIENCVPLSTILIGPPGTGKSKVILQYKGGTLHTTNDITSQGLGELLEDDKGNVLCHIIIPDFNIVVSHKASTANLTVASLLTIMSEGILRIDDGRRKKEIIHRPMGVTTAMTREIYEENAKRFRQLGIGRRFIPLHFDYSSGTRIKVNDSIKIDATNLCQLQTRKVMVPDQTKWPISVDVPKEVSERLVILARDMSDNLAMQPQWQKSYDNKSGSNESWKIVPMREKPPIEFTPHLILRALVKAHALRAGRRIVKQPDLDFVISFIPFLNYGAPVQL